MMPLVSLLGVVTLDCSVVVDTVVVGCVVVGLGVEEQSTEDVDRNERKTTNEQR